MKRHLFFLMAILAFSVSACKPDKFSEPMFQYKSPEYCEHVASGILSSSISDPYDTLECSDPSLAVKGYISHSDLDMLSVDCQKKGIPFTREMLQTYLPVNGPCLYSEVQRYQHFIEALQSGNRTEETGALESFVTRQNKSTLRDSNAEMLAMTYATIGHYYGENIAWDLNRVGVSNGRILALDGFLANYYYTNTLDDNSVEFEPDGIIWLSEISGGNWLIGSEFPIYVNGIAYGPFGWGNELVYDPTPSNEVFNECGQITSFVDGNVIGPIGGGVTSISVYGVVPPEYTYGCTE